MRCLLFLNCVLFCWYHIVCVLLFDFTVRNHNFTRADFVDGLHGLTIYYARFAVMAGLAPEGSQFDARQYDSKMSDL